MTDVSNLDNLAAAISTGSAKIRNYAMAQAAATQSQETEIRALDARLDALEATTPPPPGTTTPTPPQAPITTVSDVLIGLNIAGQTQPVWQDYDISDTADSGVIMGAIAGDPVTTLRRFRLRSIGGRVTGHPTWAVHGVYCKRPNTVLEDFDIEIATNNSLNVDGFTLRKHGIVVDRFRIKPRAFAMSYYEEDTVAGLVTIKNGTADSHSNTGIWISLNTAPKVIQRFYFENVHFNVTGGSLFAASGAGEYIGAGVTAKGCTVNGAPVTQANFQNLGTVTIQ